MPSQVFRHALHREGEDAEVAAVAACRAAVLGTAVEPVSSEGTLAERARRASTLLEDGAALMREGLYRTAHGRYLRAVELLDGLPGPRAKAAADEARLQRGAASWEGVAAAGLRAVAAAPVARGG